MYRQRLPQLDGGLFLTDGGIETTLIFHQGLELPPFAAFDLLRDEEGPSATTLLRSARSRTPPRTWSPRSQMTYAEEATGVTRAAARLAALKTRLPAVNVLGGCCGTDHRHVDAICGAWLADATART